MMSSPSPTALPLEPTVGTLRVADGVRLKETAPGAIAVAKPRGAATGRRREHLFVLLHLTGPASPSLYHELSDIVSQAYWSTTGTITAALRVAAGSANRHLLQANARSDLSQRCYGSMICAVVTGDEVFLLKTGSVWAGIRHRDWQESLISREDVPALGVGAAAPFSLSLASAAPGDTMVLTAPALTEDEHSEAIAQALGRASVEDAVDGLDEARSAADFAGLVVRFSGWEPHSAEHRTARPVQVPVHDVPAIDSMAHVPVVGPVPPPRQGQPRRAEPTRGPGAPIGERITAIVRPMRERMGVFARRAGRGLASAGASLVRAPKTLVRRMLPGADGELRRRQRPARTIPPENRWVMIALAIGIPIVLAITVALAWNQFGTEAHFDSLISQAQEEAILAKTAGGTTEEARPHWETVLALSAKAVQLRPDDPTAAGLWDQARSSLDAMDGIVRLSPVALFELGAGTSPRQLVVRGQMILVLDPSDGWVTELTLDASGDAIEEEMPSPVLLSTGQRVERETIGDLVDLVWVDLAGGRQTSGVVILEAGGAVVNFDPAWTGEDGARHLVRTALGSPPAGTPSRIGSFDGRLYVLAPDEGQIWRYTPSGDTYPGLPEAYFDDSAGASFGKAIDMTIDGNIYILYEDGAILKFLRGQQEAFAVSGVPDDLTDAVAIAADPSGRGRQVFVADRVNQRVVRLSPTGAFEAQYRADEGFGELEALAIDDTARRLFTISKGQLYVAPLP